MLKIDLHTHSTESHDGGITEAQYADILDSGKLDFVAVTDHNSVTTALRLHKKHGAKIIVGEEIMTTEGEIIGLFITRLIAAQQSPKKTMEDIKSQGGIVYIPHPFETVRSGLSEESLLSISHGVDIVEGANGRALFQNKGPQAVQWSKLNNIPYAASSDAHSANALGKTHTEISKAPTAENLARQLYSARTHYRMPSLGDITAPKINKVKRMFKKRNK